MARYPKRQKVKRYRRSFYTREMRLKKGIGIAVLVVAVLAAAWVAAPHVLDWATHTWYTVVRDRDLSASSAVSESASSGTQSTAASEPAASSVPEKEPEPEVKGTDIVTGLWAEVDVTTLTDEAAIRSAARQLKAQGMTYAILTLKDTAGQVYYASQTAVGAANAAPTQVELTSVASIIEKAIAETKDEYYAALAQADQHWHEEENDPTPFIKYMLAVICSCYQDFEQRVDLVGGGQKRVTAYERVRSYAMERLGAFTKQEAAEACPGFGTSSIESALKKLTEEGVLERIGAGRKTQYVRR